MRLNLTIENFSECIEPVSVINDLGTVLVQSVIYDSRKISSTEGVVFFALEGPFRSGSEFIEDAYKQGIRIFVVPEGYKHLLHKDCCFFFVPSCLDALQKLAQKHRQQFNIPVIAVAGSNGKTTVKEWIHYFLAPHFKVVRSPKSYNSQLGVALSLLEINENCELAIIEAGVSEPGEMKKLEAMIQPNFGVLTSVSHHKSTPFENQETYTEELLSLFRQATITWVNEEIQFTASPQNEDRINKVGLTHFSEALSLSPYQDKISVQNLSLVLAVVTYFVRSTASIDALLPNLPRLAMRMETFEGIHNNTIINDAYNLDLDALEQSLEFQKSISGSSKRVAIVSMNFLSEDKKHQIEQLISQFSLDEVIYVEGDEIPKIDHISNATVLIKGARNAQMQRIAGLFYLKKHITQLEINLSAVRHNVTFFRKKLAKNCQIIAMVKAASYGSGALKMAQFLNGIGIDYLGVAYVDEGVELRRNGIQLPILVMNSEDFGFEDIVRYQLEPTIYSFEILDAFIRFLITHNIENFPVHIEFDTGMKRLGFDSTDVPNLLSVLQSQPEIKVKSIFSHLADSDNEHDVSFTKHQVNIFQEIIDRMESELSYPFLKHICNTEGILVYPQAHFDMVRLGIGMYGYSVHESVRKQLKDVVNWRSAISQIKQIEAGESIGYSRTFVAKEKMRIGIVPVGYADGFRKSFSNGKGGMVVSGVYCPVVGNVCMDMTMIDLTHTEVKEGDPVEIIGEHQSLVNFAKKMDTIPYEVLTSISSRVQRIYSDD